MKLINKLKLIPSPIYSKAIYSFIAALMTAIGVYGVAIMLQVFTVLLGFSDVDQINSYLRPLTENITIFFIIFTIVVVAQGVGQFFQTYINIAFLEVFNYEIRKKFLNALFNSKSSWNYDLGTTSNIMSEIIPNSAGYITSLARFVTLLVQAIMLGVFCLISMPLEFLISILTLSILIPVILYLNRKSKMYGTNIIARSETLNLQLMRSVKNFLYLKILGVEKIERDSVIKSAYDYYVQYMKNNFYYALANSIPTSFATIVVVFLFYYFSKQGSSAPELLTLFYLLYRFASTLSNVVAITNGISMYAPSFDNILIVLKDALKIEINTNSLVVSEKTNIENLSLKAEDLSFSYSMDDLEYPVFKNININLPNHKMLVIKGASGSGKTTLQMVLIGMLSITSGKVSWGGVDLNDIDNEYFRNKIGYMGPEPFIISGTIRENLMYGLHQKKSIEEVWDACMKAEMNTFLKKNKRGLDLSLNEIGEGLSMGQKQRLGMARALLRDPQILILDEVTANLDPKTEASLVENIEKMKSNMTILVSTHSNAFDDIADQILELGDNQTYLKK